MALRRLGLVVGFLWLAVGADSAQLVITPTTTLSAETANNTSAADTFTTSSNGDLGAGNVSKANLRSLLYPNSNTNIYVHWIPWHGEAGYLDIGYDSADPTEIKRQTDDWISRGVQGVIVDWYGTSFTHRNIAALNLMAELQRRNGALLFAITEDGGALTACATTPLTCNLTNQVISDLTYAYNTFEKSSVYLRMGGRPVVFFFTADRYGTLDWSRISASVPGKPIFIFQNAGAFTHASTAGGFSWVGHNPDPTLWGQSYLDNFYKTALLFPSLHAFGSTINGYDDSLAYWGQYRLINQNCGQTWFDTFAEIGKYYSATNQLPSLQLVTWNDYEEGTEIESGIDNCVFVTTSLTGTALNWSIAGGDESTVDHYNVFISTDGQNLMLLSSTPVGNRSLNLSNYQLAAGTYVFYVKAVARASLSNKMSNPVNYTVGDQPPAVSFVSASSLSGSAPLTVSTAITASDSDGTITGTDIDLGDGTTVTGTSASHVYEKPGMYRILATAHDNDNSSSAASELVTVTNQRPVAALSVSPSSANAPATIRADASGSYDPDGSIASTKIDFGDGTVLAGPVASHTYSLAGAYTITATVIDNFGAFSQQSATANIPGPVVTVSSPTNAGSVTSPVHVVASASSATPITAMSIFADGVLLHSHNGASTDAYVNVMPDATHNIQVTATDSAGATGTNMVTVWVKDRPPLAVLDVSPASGSAPLSVTASTSRSTDPDDSVASSTINFGDGTTAAGPRTTHTYAAAGNYTVKATVRDTVGGVSTTSAPVFAAGVRIQIPTSGAIVNSPVHVVASAFSTKPITAMRIYVDSVFSFYVAAGSLDTSVAISAGTHKITVQAWDSGGAVYKSSLTLTVQ